MDHRYRKGMTLPYEPIQPLFGAVLTSNLQLCDFSDEDIESLHQLGAERGIIVARNQKMNSASQAAFARRLGETFKTPVNQTDVPEDLILIQATAKSKRVAGQGWHSDVSSEKTPPGFSMLRMEVVPDSGGDTLFADMRQAFDRLSLTMQTFLCSLEAKHVPRGHYLYLSGAKRLDELPASVHPVVRRHPRTGEKALFVNTGFVDHIVGLSACESDSLLKMLYDHVAYSVDIQCRVHWQENTVVLWDNRIVQHHAAFDYFPQSRKGYRATIRGEALVPG